MAICLLDRYFPEFEKCFSKTCGATAREVLKYFPVPKDLAACNLNELVELIEKASHGHSGVDTATKLKDVAAASFGATFGLDAYKISLNLLLEQLSFMDGQVDQIDRHIEELMRDQNLILTIPGVGPVLGAAILGEIGDISRFSSAKKLKAYAGLDATVSQSGEYVCTRSRISKRGSRFLRRALWLAALSARIHDHNFKDFYELKLSQGKHPNQALIAVAAKLCNVIFAVLSNKTAYDPNWNSGRDIIKDNDSPGFQREITTTFLQAQ